MEYTVEYTIDKEKHPLTAEMDIMKNRLIGKTSEILLITKLLSYHKNIKISGSRCNSPFLYFESFLPPYIELIAESHTNFLFFCFKSNIH
jgi:hypothetical protein